MRDETIYLLFCCGVTEHCFTLEQVNYLSSQIIEKQLLLKNIDSSDNDSVLMRSFTAFVLALILETDNDEYSPYFIFQSEEQRNAIFESAISFMEQERDFRGYDEQLGWIHAIAHGSDLLSAVAAHRHFPIHKREAILNVIEKNFS